MDIFDSVAQSPPAPPQAQPPQVTTQSQPNTQQPAGDVFDQVANDAAKPQSDDIGLLHRFWNWTLGTMGPDAEKYRDKGLVETFERSMRGSADQSAKRMEQTAVGTNKELNDAIARINADPRETPDAKKWLIERAKEEYGGSAVDVGVSGALADTAKVVRGAGTKGNVAAATAAAVVPPLRLPIAAYYAINGAVDAMTPQQEGESNEDAIQRKLLGAATLFGGAAGATEGAPAFGKFAKGIGSNLIDYAPKIGKLVKRGAQLGSATAAVTSAWHGDIGGAAKEAAGTLGSAVLGPKIEAGATKLSQLTGHASNLVGNGMIWLGNLMKADIPLPMTKAALSKVKDVELEAVAEKALKNVGETESEQMDKASKEPISVVFKADQPYIAAAQKELGDGASIEQVGELARKLKAQDEYLSNVIQRNSDPRIMHGEGTLNRVLAAQSNKNLIKVAKSRGIDVTREAQLKEKVANSLLVKKIINDMSFEELQEIGDRNLENSRFSHQFPQNLGQEAANTLGLNEYFPEVKIAKAVQTRTAKAVAGPKH